MRQSKPTKMSIKHYDHFINALDVWLPDKYSVSCISVDDEKIITRRCFKELDTYTMYITGPNTRIPICGVCRDGYFIIGGKPYVWPWKEVFCPNWIYKYEESVVCWSAPLKKPWEMYKGRLKVCIHQMTLCVEGPYNKGRMTLLRFLEDYEMSDLTHHFGHDFNRLNYLTFLNGKWKGKMNIFEEHPILPHLESKDGKEKFISLMIVNLLDEHIPISDLDDVKSKRIVGVNWLVGDLCDKLDKNPRHYMIKRIHTHGQLVELSSAFELISHVSRVVRGSPSYGSDRKRELHESHRGVFCPYRTSEGEKIGLVVDLVPDAKITYDIKEFASKHLQNGFIESSSIPSCESQYWTWTDGSRVIPSVKNAIGQVARQIVFRRHMPPVRCMYATTHLRQIVRQQYPQKPVVYSKSANETIMNGCNVLVAVSGYHGWNIEDAIVCSKSFVERGGLCSIISKTVSNSISIKKETWTEPLLQVGTYVVEKDNILTYKNGENKTNSISGVSGRIKSSVTVNNDKTRVLHLEKMHKVELGDKLSSRSGQKGIVGHMPVIEDMPYTVDGIVPDLIINPAHLPSRMTVSQMLESYFGKEAIIDGKCIGDDEEKQINEMSGKEIFFCGRSGKKMKNALFFGSVYYLALKHMVHKKCRVRNTGGSIKLTGQPTKGGQSNGGLRIGEMERDALRCRDAVSVLQDRLCKSSDMMCVRVCKSCGWLEPNKECCNEKNWKHVQMPRTTRLFLMEMYALGIFPKLHL